MKKAPLPLGSRFVNLPVGMQFPLDVNATAKLSWQSWSVTVERDLGELVYCFGSVLSERGGWWGGPGQWAIGCTDIQDGSFQMSLQWDDSVTDFSFGALLGFRRASGGLYVPIAFRFNTENRNVDATIR